MKIKLLYDNQILTLTVIVIVKKKTYLSYMMYHPAWM